jgi:hypothetical protein
MRLIAVFASLGAADVKAQTEQIIRLDRSTNSNSPPDRNQERKKPQHKLFPNRGTQQGVKEGNPQVIVVHSSRRQAAPKKQPERKVPALPAARGR